MYDFREGMASSLAMVELKQIVQPKSIISQTKNEGGAPNHRIDFPLNSLLL